MKIALETTYGVLGAIGKGFESAEVLKVDPFEREGSEAVGSGVVDTGDEVKEDGVDL